jgi:hypothetical protein
MSLDLPMRAADPESDPRVPSRSRSRARPPLSGCLPTASGLVLPPLLLLHEPPLDTTSITSVTAHHNPSAGR